MILRYYSEKKSQAHLTSNFDQTYRMPLDIYYLYLTVPYILVDGTVTIQSSAFHECYIVHVHVVDHDDGITCVPPHPHHVKKTKKEMFQKKTTNTPQMCLGDPELGVTMQKSNNFKLLQETFGWESRT